ncbi:Rpn family recombination-promoting nuclease/putative transposase [Oxalobacteraceae bacterium A2-2]
MNSPHDHLYKQLFSHPELVRELLRGFVPQDWAQRLELDALERVNASYVGRHGAQRHDDLVWRVRLDGDWLYLYLLLELQARPERWMALRMQVYVGLLCQDLVRQRKLTRGGMLPPVLPVVLYHGARPWRAPTDLSHLMLPAPQGLEGLQPRQRYLLIDGATAVEDGSTRSNLVAALFHLIRARDQAALERTLVRFVEHLRNPEMLHVRDSLLRWLDFILNAQAFETKVTVETNEGGEIMLDRKWRDMEDFYQWQAHQMGLEKGLENGLKKGLEKGLEQGLEHGLEQGWEQGLEQGRSQVRQMLRDWFASAGLPLTAQIGRRIDAAALPQAVQWMCLLAQGRSVEQVFADT